MTNYKLVLVLFILLPAFVFGQDLDYAKSIVSTLASNDYKGRGYVDNGEKKAADFIANEFKDIGLLPFSKTYFQPFKTSVNTYPSTMLFEVNRQPLIPGKDYLIDPGSPEIKGTFKTVYISIKDLFNQQKLANILKRSSGKFIIIPSFNKNDYTKTEQQQITDIVNFIKYHPANLAAGSIILTNDKLTWSGSTTLNPKPSFTLKNEKFNDAIDEITLDIENKFYKHYKTQNVLGYIKGKNPDSLLVITAHYDHLGMMGAKTIFPGANDNASGVAMLLNLAKHYSKKKPNYSIAFIAFGGEELGLLGAQHFVENPLFNLKKIKFLINFDISGTGDEGIQVVNGKIHKDEFEGLVAINNNEQLLKQVKIRGEACNSDHCVFHRENVPCFYIYTLGGIKAYHDIFDKAETLPLTKFEDYFKLMQQFLNSLK